MELFLRMPVQQTIPYNDGIFFITLTCHKWLPLIEMTNDYNLLYKWFDYLKIKGHKIYGYVLMPNHVLINFVNTHQSINTIVGNGRRFIAYGIIKRLKEKQENSLLNTLAKNVEAKRRSNNKLHEVWKLSFDWKYCNGKVLINKSSTICMIIPVVANGMYAQALLIISIAQQNVIWKV